jgi:exopolyphosphatase/pppGpp-phosphohydrolase
VGGASTEIAVGEMGAAASWTSSADIGAVRLTERLFRGHEAPDEEALTGAEEEVERCFALVDPPTAAFALATGGTARAIRKLVGRTLGPEELAEARRLVVGRSAAELALHYGFDPGRARVLAAGVVVLAAVQRRIGVPLEVCREGLREGAMLAAFDELAAA